MNDITYESIITAIKLDYDQFLLQPKRFRSFRLHLGEEFISDKNGDMHWFDIVWFKDTEELIAVEVEQSTGTVFPLNFKLRKSTNRYLFLGQFTEEGIDDVLPFQGHIIEHLWTLHVGESRG